MGDRDDEVCFPLDTVQQLSNLARLPPAWSKLTVSISKRSSCVRNGDICVDRLACHFGKSLPSSSATPVRYQYGTLPKTLVCHDMKNGYLEDRFIDGVKDSSAYLFYHWAAIDMFVYFSHHFITIPPLGWINVAHKHGVQILGTIITEWEDGKKLCNQFLNSDEDMNTFIRNLVSTAKHFKMDGWLLNIENKIENPQMLVKFVKLLTDEMHKAIVGSVVIWYDSVTSSGNLAWQDMLNRSNKIYFDQCDGIFLNYCWSKWHLEETVKNAGNRKLDVFVGVDVWGRNFWGGGRFNTAEAVKEIHNYNLSLAIFAPGWTHEAIRYDELRLHSRHSRNSITSDELKNCYSNSGFISSNYKCIYRELFMLRESALWNTLWPYLNTRGPTEMPFHTFFCVGSGEKRRYGGDVINDETWFNLREQQYQTSNPCCSENFALESVENSPVKREEQSQSNEVKDDNKDSLNDKINIPGEASSESLSSRNQKKLKPPIKRFALTMSTDPGCLLHHSHDSYYGGTCLKICPSKKSHTNEIGYRQIVRVLLCEFHCDFNFIVYYITKSRDPAAYQDLNLLLTIKNKNNDRLSTVILCCENATIIPSNDDQEIILKPINFELSSSQSLKKNLLNSHPGFWIDPENKADWKIRYYNITCRNSVMLNIDCELANDSCPMLLGGLGVVKDVLTF